MFRSLNCFRLEFSFVLFVLLVSLSNVGSTNMRGATGFRSRDQCEPILEYFDDGTENCESCKQLCNIGYDYCNSTCQDYVWFYTTGKSKVCPCMVTTTHPADATTQNIPNSTSSEFLWDLNDKTSSDVIVFTRGTFAGLLTGGVLGGVFLGVVLTVVIMNVCSQHRGGIKGLYRYIVHGHFVPAGVPPAPHANI